MRLGFSRLVKENLFLVFVIILIFVISIANVRDSHDWGGDFAMYLSQSQNIINCSVGETGYIFNPDYPMLSPKEYPPFFSILLTPIVAIWGIEIQPILFFMAIIFALYVIFLFVFFSKVEKINKWWSLLLSLVFFLNPFTQKFKNEISAEIILAFIFLLFLIAYKKKNVWYLGILTACAILTKEIGYSLLCLFFIDYLISFIKKEVHWKKIGYDLLKFIGVIFLIVVTIKLVFSGSLGGGYANHFKQENFWETIWSNIGYYQQVIQYFFEVDLLNWKLYQPIAYFLGIVGVCMFIFGWINNGKRIYGILMFIYFGILLVYPYQCSGFRFLVPIIPIILLWIFQSLDNYSWRSEKLKTGIKVFFFVVCLGSYIQQDNLIYKTKNQIQYGPNEAKNQAWMTFVKENVQQDDIVLFIKPRVLYLYSGCKSITPRKQATIEQIEVLIDNYNVSYIVYYQGFSNDNIKKAMDRNPLWQLIYHQDEIQIFNRGVFGYR